MVKYENNKEETGKKDKYCADFIAHDSSSVVGIHDFSVDLVLTVCPTRSGGLT